MRRTEDVRHVRVILSHLEFPILQNPVVVNQKSTSIRRKGGEQGRKRERGEDVRVPVIPCRDILVLFLSPRTRNVDLSELLTLEDVLSSAEG